MDYYLIPNKLTDDGSYSARIVAGRSYTEDELIDKILSKRNIVSRPDLEGVMAALEEALVEIIEEGNCLNLSWLKLSYGMKGRFDSINTRRNPADHPLEISVNAGSLLADAVSKIRLLRVTTPEFGSRIVRFTDGQSKTSNTLMTPGGVFEITGERLRVDGPQSKDIGLYLQDQDGTETKVEILLRNEPTYLCGQLPTDLPSGTYQLVIKTQVGTSGNRFLKEVHTASVALA